MKFTWADFDVENLTAVIFFSATYANHTVTNYTLLHR